jgi:acetylornithine deacetylase/succinyl-diaminopimelate desuccinylase-like protein
VTPVELLQQLIRFDTTNPPGNESECIGFVRNLLEEAGCETQTYAKDPVAAIELGTEAVTRALQRF